MENVIWVALPLIGLTGGFVSGLLGIGGGVIMLPLLTFIGKVPLKLATGTDLVHVFIVATTGMLSYFRKGMVDLKAGLIIGIAGVAGGFIGSFICISLSSHFLQLLYLFVIGLAIALLFIPLKLEDENYEKGNFNKPFGISIGFGVGSLAGLLGVGGGFIIIPFMIYFLKIPLRVAIGTSLLIILISSIGTIGAKFGVGHINLFITLLVISGSVIGALIGAHVSRKTNVVFLRLILLSLLITILITVGYKTITMP
ncbi:MAG: sulfite exporter TauE/SafE family protein [Thermodesulfobacteriota bacterium]